MKNKQETAFMYQKGSAILAEYLRMNGYARVVVDRASRAGGWAVWLMRADAQVGTYTYHDLKRDAVKTGRELADHCGLPIEFA